MNETDPVPLSTREGRLADLWLATSFLTRLPLSDSGPVPAGRLARSMGMFPLVGTGLGLASGAVLILAWALVPPLPAALLALTAATLLTGALHEDGLADTADGMGASGCSRERRLEIMRDSRIGAFGALALVLAVALKASALASAPGPWQAAGALVAAAALSRAVIPAAMQILPAARADGLGAGAGTPDAGVAALAGGLALAVAALGLGLAGAAIAMLAGLAAAAGVAALSRRILGGHTGDVLGAVQQATEIAVLLAAAGGWR